MILEMSWEEEISLCKLEKRVQDYIIPEVFDSLASDVKFQVTLLLNYIRDKWIMRASSKESKYLLDLEVIHPEYQDFFISALNDPRTSEQKESDFKRAKEEIFG